MVRYGNVLALSCVIRIFCSTLLLWLCPVLWELSLSITLSTNLVPFFCLGDDHTSDYQHPAFLYYLQSSSRFLSVGCCCNRFCFYLCLKATTPKDYCGLVVPIMEFTSSISVALVYTGERYSMCHHNQLTKQFSFSTSAALVLRFE